MAASGGVDQMSQAKQEMEKEYERRLHVCNILRHARVAQPCPAHGHLVYIEREPTPAYKLGVYRWKRDAELHTLFDTTTELTDAIKSTFQTDVSDVCPHGDYHWPRLG